MKKYYNVEKINLFMKNNNINKVEFCKKCGVSLKTLNNVFKQNPKLNLKSIVKIMNVLNESIFLF